MTCGLSMRIQTTWVVSSNLPCVTMKTPLLRKATGNHPINSTSPEKTQSPVSAYSIPGSPKTRQGSEIFSGQWMLRGGFPLPSSPIVFRILKS